MKSDRNNPMFMPYPNMQQGMMGMPNMQQGMMGMPNMNMGDIENRISSLERAVRRIDTRVSRLEGSTGYASDTGQYNTSLPNNYNQNTYPNAMHMM